MTSGLQPNTELRSIIPPCEGALLRIRFIMVQFSKSVCTLFLTFCRIHKSNGWSTHV